MRAVRAVFIIVSSWAVVNFAMLLGLYAWVGDPRALFAAAVLAVNALGLWLWWRK